VESRYGWHVVEVVQRVEGAQLPFEAVRERIAEYLTERSRRRAFSQYVRLLVAEARIEGVELEGADSPLLQ
jgi:peptidyl-prolyl cis-trans isomerase C